MATSNRTNPAAKNSAESENRMSQQSSSREPTADLMEYLRDYAREKPEAAALWCLGIGFVLGWKLKPW
jgi:hypothetical protein